MVVINHHVRSTRYRFNWAKVCLLRTVLNGFLMFDFFNRNELLLRMINQLKSAETAIFKLQLNETNERKQKLFSSET